MAVAVVVVTEKAMAVDVMEDSLPASVVVVVMMVMVLVVAATVRPDASCPHRTG